VEGQLGGQYCCHSGFEKMHAMAMHAGNLHMRVHACAANNWPGTLQMAHCHRNDLAVPDNQELQNVPAQMLPIGSNSIQQPHQFAVASCKPPWLWANALDGI
jgi:hypothetical protein